jgi:hypothetical protein
MHDLELCLNRAQDACSPSYRLAFNDFDFIMRDIMAEEGIITQRNHGLIQICRNG